jgi:hypothetical protein
MAAHGEKPCDAAGEAISRFVALFSDVFGFLY